MFPVLPPVDRGVVAVVDVVVPAAGVAGAVAGVVAVPVVAAAWGVDCGLPR